MYRPMWVFAHKITQCNNDINCVFTVCNCLFVSNCETREIGPSKCATKLWRHWATDRFRRNRGAIASHSVNSALSCWRETDINTQCPLNEYKLKQTNKTKQTNKHVFVFRSSSSSNLLHVHCTNLIFGSRSFRAAAPTTGWAKIVGAIDSWPLFYQS